MSFKMKTLAAACAALGSAGAFAACPVNATVDAACNIKPAAKTYYIAGASAQSQAFNAVAKALFDVAADVIQVQVGAPAPDAGNIQKHVGYYGIRGGAATLIVYRNAGGSGAGVRQLVSKTTAAYSALPGAGTENVAVTLGACGVVAGAPGTYTTTCTTSAAQVPSLALSDVQVSELATGVVPAAGANYYSTAALQSAITGLQGFGVAVNTKLFAALQAQNLAQGKALGPNGQPSIRRADYASLVSVSGNIKDANGFLQPAVPDATPIVVCRRSDTSGTQASSNLFFLNNVSGTIGFGGALLPESAVYPGVTYNLATSTGNAKACLGTNENLPNGPTDYRIGVLSLENLEGADAAPNNVWKFVAIDGVSPNYTYNVNGAATVLDPKLRQQHAAGNYPFAYESVLVGITAAPADVQGLYTALSTKIADSTQSDLVGFAYEDLPGTWNLYNSALPAPANKQSRVFRGGNNSQPLLP